MNNIVVNHIVLSSCKIYDIYMIDDIIFYNNSYICYRFNDVISVIPGYNNIQLLNIGVSDTIIKILYYDKRKIVIIINNKIIFIDIKNKKCVNNDISIKISNIIFKNNIIYILSNDNIVYIYKNIKDILKLQSEIKIKCNKNDTCRLYDNKYIVCKYQLKNTFKIYTIDKNNTLKKSFTIKIQDGVYISNMFTYNPYHNTLITLCNFNVMVYDLNNNINNKYTSIDDIIDKKIDNIAVTGNYLLIYRNEVIYFYYYYKCKYIRMQNMYIKNPTIYNAKIKNIKNRLRNGVQYIYFITPDITYVYEIIK